MTLSRPFTGARVETVVKAYDYYPTDVAPSQGRELKHELAGQYEVNEGRPFTGARVETLAITHSA